MKTATTWWGAAAVAALAAPPALAQTGGIYDLSWSTVDCGGQISPSTGGIYGVAGTTGQADAGRLAGAPFILTGGFWAVIAPDTCYGNCDGSTVQPILNVSDFICFQTRFAAGDPYANCDGSTVQPVLNVSDFICYQTKFAAGCP